MPSKMFGTATMIVPYEWNFECVEEEPITISSKMILFRGEKVFRVGLKNHTKSPILFFMAIDLGKIGMKVNDVMYEFHGSGIGPTKMTKMTRHDLGDEGNLQLFSVLFPKKLVGKRTFVFRICIEGADSGYSFQLCDRLAKDQLWAALKNQQHLFDVVLIVKDKPYPAHKAILAARSQVFADEFERLQLDGLMRIETGAEHSTFVNFLHFIYTSEPKGTLADEELLKLADHYQLTTMSRLCQHALKKTNAMQMTKVNNYLKSNPEEISSYKFMPEEETEIMFDRTKPTFRCPWLLKKSENGQTKCVMEFLNEDFFIAYYTEEKEIDSQVSQDDNSKLVIHFTCAKHCSFGLQIEDVYCGMPDSETWRYNRWLKMEPKHHKKNAELLHFTEQALLGFSKGNLQFRVYFHIKTICTIDNYFYEMMDNKWPTDLWAATKNQNLTDVEIFAGTVKVMEAHRVILCARSPVLNASLTNISYTEKSIVTFGPEFHFEVVYFFLKFLYTGRLEITDSSQQLSKLATIYQVETLKNVCQLLNRVPGVEELTNCLI